MLALFPGGFEEGESGDTVELAGYGSPAQASVAGGALASDGWRATIGMVEPGWDAAWQRFHRPVVIDDLWLGPPWAAAPAGLRAVTIRPGMAFGTGAHPTTRLCIELLVRQAPSALLDLGCGSGVLSVVAAVAGFAPVTALDTDAVAVEETRENAARNDVDVAVLSADARLLEPSQPPLVTANLPLETLLESMAAIEPRRAIVSGFQAGVVPEVPGYRTAERAELDGWAAAVLVRASEEAIAHYP